MTAPAPLTGCVESAGLPLPGVTVTLTDRAGAQVARTRTGPDGLFSLDGLPPGTYVVIFSAPGHHPHAATLVRDAAPHRPLAVALTPSTYSVRGLVHDARTGQPVAAATVTAVDAGGDVVAATVSDPDGTYRITGIDVPEITLAVAAPGADPFATVVRFASADGVAPDRTVDVPLATCSTLAGTVTAGGRAVAGLQLVLRDGDGREVAATVTDGGGRYRFDRLPAGSYTLTGVPSAPAAVPLGPGTATADVVLTPP